MERLYRFWQELKRRNVVRRNAVYAATAFVILELFSIIQQPLKLPEWTLTLVIILLCSGFVISVILSWIYEINPEGGLTKTKPAEYQTEEEQQALISPRWKFATYTSLVVIVILIIMNVIPRVEKSSTIDLVEKSIAVLPLNNLSADSSKIYFCEAMREEILNQLDKVEAFTVRSRTSTDRYRNTSKSTIEIGKELNVNYVIEGSVGFDGSTIKIWLQLINAQSDEHLWSGDFTRKNKQIFTLQREIASTLAGELQTTLTPEEIKKIEQSPTDNPDAYHSFMRGNYFADQPHDDRNHWDKALSNYLETVALDSSFGLAWAALAKTYAIFHYYKYDLSETNLKKADEAAAMALKLGTGDPEVHLQIGYYYMFAYNDSEHKSEHWEIAARELPSDVRFLKARHISLREKGEWDEAMRMIEKAAEINPNDFQIFSQMGISLWFLRRYADSEASWNRSSTLAPDAPFPRSGIVFNYYSWKGVNDGITTSVKSLNPSHNWTSYLQFWYEAGQGRLQEALQMVSDTSKKWIVFNPVYKRPASLYRAMIFRHQGKDALAMENFQSAAAFLEGKIKEDPLDDGYLASLGIAYAALGRREAALTMINRAIELRPLSESVSYGTAPLFNAIIIYLYLGDLERAMEQFDYMLSFPSPYSIIWPDWYFPMALLRDHPGYQALVNKYS